jgi:tight adherence protein C
MPNQNLIIAASVLWGLACAGLAGLALSFLTRPVRRREPLDSFETARRERLRSGSSIYRWFEPGVDRLAPWNARRLGPEKLEKFQRNLLIAAEPLPWRPEEYVALKQVEGFLAGTGGVAFGGLVFGNLFGGLVLGGMVAVLYQTVMSSRVGSKAAKRLRELKRRLPFTVDLMALMMEAGAGFQESLASAIRENQGHPIGDEFGLVLREVNLGRTRSEALLALQHRLGDEDLAEIVFAVNKGEELGTPLSQILRSQAEQMRLKRTQWLEKASGEAQVNIVFPGMVIMVACLLIVGAPFLLGALFPS